MLLDTITMSSEKNETDKFENLKLKFELELILKFHWYWETYCD
jgi:hypothetical protein